MEIKLATLLSTKLDDFYSGLINIRAVNRLTKAIQLGVNGKNAKDTRFVRLSEKDINKLNELRRASGLLPYTKRQVITYENAINRGLIKRVKENPKTITPRRVAQIAFDALMKEEGKIFFQGKGDNQIVVSPYTKQKYNGVVLGLNKKDGGTSLKSIEPRTKAFVKKQLRIKK